MSNSSIRPIDRTLSGATILGQSGPGNGSNKWVLGIPQSSGITGSSGSDCLVLDTRYPLKESYSSVEKQSLYSKAPTDLARLREKDILRQRYDILILFVRD